jgi:drug/metabolite transporter (DMT)-like permease
MNPELSAVVFGLLSSASWGAGDFGGAMAARRMSAVAVVALSHVIALGLLVAVIVVVREPMPPTADLLWAALSAIAGATGLYALFRALSGGQMGLAAPISAVLTAAVPVVVSAFLYGLPTSLQLLGFLVGFASLFLVSFTGGRVHDPRIIGLAILAGLSFGVFFVLLDQVSDAALFWPLAASRASSSVMMLGVSGFMRLKLRPPEPRTWRFVLMSAVLDVAGNGFFLLASQVGRLDIASVASSLYPAMTILLSWIILKERFNTVRLVGVALAVLAVVMITIG